MIANLCSMTIHFGLCKYFCAAECLVLLEFFNFPEGVNQHPRNCQGPGFLRKVILYFCHGPRKNVKRNIRN